MIWSYLRSKQGMPYKLQGDTWEVGHFISFHCLQCVYHKNTENFCNISENVNQYVSVCQPFTALTEWSQLFPKVSDCPLSQICQTTM